MKKYYYLEWNLVFFNRSVYIHMDVSNRWMFVREISVGWPTSVVKTERDQVVFSQTLWLTYREQQRLWVPSLIRITDLEIWNDRDMDYGMWDVMGVQARIKQPRQPLIILLLKYVIIKRKQTVLWPVSGRVMAYQLSLEQMDCLLPHFHQKRQQSIQ